VATGILSPFESTVFLWKHISVLCTPNCSVCFLYFIHYDIERGGNGVEDVDGGGDEHEEGSGDGETSTSRRKQPKMEDGRQKEERIKDGCSSANLLAQQCPMQQ
jgi:hypothetical protein